MNLITVKAKRAHRVGEYTQRTFYSLQRGTRPVKMFEEPFAKLLGHMHYYYISVDFEFLISIIQVR